MTTFRVTEAVDIDAPIDRVWKIIRNFHDFSWAEGMVKSCLAIGEVKGTTVGAKRVANGVFHETLLELDESGYTLRYLVEEGPPPLTSTEVSDFQGVMQLRENSNDGTCVEWSAIWNAEDDAGVKFCKGMYKGLLREMAKHCSSH